MLLAARQNRTKPSATRSVGSGLESEILRSNSTGIKIRPFLIHCRGRMARTSPRNHRGSNRHIASGPFINPSKVLPRIGYNLRTEPVTVVLHSPHRSVLSPTLYRVTWLIPQKWNSLERAGSGMSIKQRLDILLVERGLVNSRELARRMIMAGEVMVNGQAQDKPGVRIPVDADLTLKAVPRFVSRGGEKLDAALTAFALPVEGKVCADVGASTGGFTDCLLQRGAARVYAIDVGYGQMDYRLRQDARVVV